MKKWRAEDGFTLPELIVAVLLFLIAGLAAAIVLSPSNYQPEERASEQRLAMAQILQALNKYQHDKGKLPDGISSIAQEIGNQTGQLNLCPELVPSYLKDMPLDPLTGAKASTKTKTATTEPCTAAAVEYVTGFTIAKNDQNHLIIKALLDENSSGKLLEMTN